MTSKFDPDAFDNQVVKGSHSTQRLPPGAVEYSEDVEYMLTELLGETDEGVSFYSFLTSVRDQGEQRGYLTERQHEVVQNSFNKLQEPDDPDWVDNASVDDIY